MPQFEVMSATYITELSVIDPFTKQAVRLQVYQLPNGAMVGLDTDMNLEASTVFSPYDEEPIELDLCEDPYR